MSDRITKVRRRCLVLKELRTQLTDVPWPLTDRQREVYEFIRESILVEQRSPTLREICVVFGFQSTNTVTHYLNVLESWGLVARSGTRSRNTCPRHGRLSLPSVGRIPLVSHPKGAFDARSISQMPTGYQDRRRHYDSSDSDQRESGATGNCRAG